MFYLLVCSTFLYLSTVLYSLFLYSLSSCILVFHQAVAGPPSPVILQAQPVVRELRSFAIRGSYKTWTWDCGLDLTVDCNMDWTMEWTGRWNGLWTGPWNGLWTGPWTGLWNGLYCGLDCSWFAVTPRPLPSGLRRARGLHLPSTCTAPARSCQRLCCYSR